MKSTYTTLVVVSILALGVFVASVAWYRHITYLNAELAQIEGELAARGGDAPQSRTARERLAQDQALVEEYLVFGDKVPAFINDLEARGEALGATVTTASVGKSGTGLEEKLLLSQTIKGSFATVLQTVGAIEYAPYALTITSLALVKDIDGGWHADLKLVVASPPPLTP